LKNFSAYLTDKPQNLFNDSASKNENFNSKAYLGTSLLK